MELQQLKYFQVVARLEHMTKAAEELHITQPSLSITIARLEEALGAPLFDRFGRNIKLNEFGQLFLKRVERIFRELEEGKREVRDLAGLELGTVNLASTNLVFLPSLLRSFLEKYPHVKFRLVQDTVANMQKQLADGLVDFCVTSPPILGEGIKSLPVLNEEIVLIVPNHHRLAGRESIDILEVKDEAFINVKKGYSMRDLTDQYCQQKGFTPNTLFEVDDPSLVAEIVESGLGIAFYPLNAWTRRANNNKFTCLYLKGAPPKRTISLSWLENRYLSKASRSFRDFILHYFEQFNK